MEVTQRPSKEKRTNRCINCNSLIHSKGIVCTRCLFKMKNQSNLDEVAEAECYGFIDVFWKQRAFLVRRFPKLLVLNPKLVKLYITSLESRFSDIISEIKSDYHFDSKSFLLLYELRLIVNEVLNFSSNSSFFWNELDKIDNVGVYSKVAHFISENESKDKGIFHRVKELKLYGVIELQFFFWLMLSISLIAWSSIYFYKSLL